MSVEVGAVSDFHRERPDHPSASTRGALKIGVIGAGTVGCACLLATVMRGCARESKPQASEGCRIRHAIRRGLIANHRYL
jgi:hypothetical protein